MKIQIANPTLCSHEIKKANLKEVIKRLREKIKAFFFIAVQLSKITGFKSYTRFPLIMPSL